LHVAIDAQLRSKCPGVALAGVAACVEVTPSPEPLLDELSARQQAAISLQDPRSLLAAREIVTTRAAYKALGKDPARYRGSAEALLRRLIAGKPLPQINCVVDIINLVSVESRLPIGLYDLAHVKGPMVFRVGRAGETYKGIGKYDLNLEGLPIFCDELGPHGSPTSDSERTMVTESTKNVLAIVISFAGEEGLRRWTSRMTHLFETFAAGRECRTLFA
jgi:DNA/RNA-binding domain of Phe-tRNA-synthetase-like protein